MQRASTSIRNKLMVACAFVVACVLATPAALANGRHDRHGHSADVIAALVVGAVIGGVLVSVNEHHDGYYGNGYYYPQAYPPPPPPRYYPPRAYPPPPPPRYYGNSGHYRYPSHGGVHVGVVYSSGGHPWQAPGHRDRGHR